MWRKKLVTTSEFVAASISEQQSSTSLLSFSRQKMVEDEQWRKIIAIVHALTLLLCSSMACYIVPYYHNPVLSHPNREIISHRHHHRFSNKLLKTRIRVPRSSAISDGGVSYNTLVSEVSQFSGQFILILLEFSVNVVDLCSL